MAMKNLAKLALVFLFLDLLETKSDHPYYILAEEIAYQLTQHGYGVITGGGPGNYGGWKQGGS